MTTALFSSLLGVDLFPQLIIKQTKAIVISNHQITFVEQKQSLFMVFSFIASQLIVLPSGRLVLILPLVSPSFHIDTVCHQSSRTQPFWILSFTAPHYVRRKS